MATKVIEIDLAQSPTDLTDLQGYTQLLALVRWEHSTLGQLRMTVSGDRISGYELWIAASRAVQSDLSPHLIRREPIFDIGEPSLEADTRPSFSIVICTRDRTEDLRRCLNAIFADTADDNEVIVVDNAPSSDATEVLCREFPVHYVMEKRQGLNWARARGAAEANGEIVIYTDDDVVVGKGWVEAFQETFSDPEVVAVAGLVMPYELENDAQELFERYCGFIRGFHRREFTANVINPIAAANIGAGACMAFRRHLVLDYALFNVELDAGTATRTGGDTYALYRLLSLGYRIVYNPDIVVWHRHRQDFGKVREALFGYSLGTYAFFLRCLFRHGEFSVLQAGLEWFIKHHLKQLWLGLLGRPGAQPLILTYSEIKGCIATPWAYWRSRHQERKKLQIASQLEPKSLIDSAGGVT